MKNLTKCEGCNKRTNALRYWLGKLLCPECYILAGSKTETIPVSKIAE